MRTQRMFITALVREAMVESLHQLWQIQPVFDRKALLSQAMIRVLALPVMVGAQRNGREIGGFL